MNYQFALIGCGAVAQYHAAGINQYGTVAAVCDVIPERANAFAKQYGAKAYTDIDDLLKAEKDIDIVSICSPTGLHAEHAIKSLQAGKHVLCEQPFCLSQVAGWQMLETAYHFKRKLLMVPQNPISRPAQVVKQLLDERKLGALHSFQINCFEKAAIDNDWRSLQWPGGGLLYTQFYNMVHLIHSLFGDMALVQALTHDNQKRANFDIEDTGVVLLKTQHGAIGSFQYTINAPQQNAENTLTLLAEKGSIKIGGADFEKIEWLHSENMNQQIFSDDVISNREQTFAPNYTTIYNDITKTLNHNESDVTAVNEALKTIELIEKIYKAAANY